jgi:hypothetical protein
VRGHDRPAEVGVHGEVAERGLRDRPGQDREREPAAASREARCQERPDSGQQHEHDHDSAEGAVSELDERVVVLGRQRVAGLAPGPVTAAEA